MRIILFNLHQATHMHMERQIFSWTSFYTPHRHTDTHFFSKSSAYLGLANWLGREKQRKAERRIF